MLESGAVRGGRMACGQQEETLGMVQNILLSLRLFPPAPHECLLFSGASTGFSKFRAVQRTWK